MGWWGANTDFTLGRRWFLDASFEAAAGGLEHSAQLCAGLSRHL